MEVAAITAAGPDSWEVVVHYGTEDQQNSQKTREPGTWHFNFGTTGGTHTITQSMQTIWRGQRSQVNPAPDLLGAVNYDGKIEYRTSKGYLFNIPTHQTWKNVLTFQEYGAKHLQGTALPSPPQEKNWKRRVGKWTQLFSCGGEGRG